MHSGKALRFLCFMGAAVCMITGSCGRPYSAVEASPGTGVVLIDPGHGGLDGGAVAADGTAEKNINLAIALDLRDMLFISGFTVQMTRKTDVSIHEEGLSSISQQKVSDMRCRLALYESAQTVISIHQNHFGVPKYHGTQVFYSPNHQGSAHLASCIRESVISELQPTNTRELKKASDGIYLLYHTTRPAVLVECGFLSNPEERESLKKVAYQQRMAFAIAGGYWRYVCEHEEG